MIVLYVCLLALGLTALDLIFLKNYQLENYLIKKYTKNILKFNFSFGKKNILKFTNRAKRLIFLNFLINFLLFLSIFCIFYYLLTKILLILLLFVFAPFVVLLTFLCEKPLECCVKSHYIRLSKKKLAQFRGKKIAITGSFGKTSTKNILYQILKEGFDVCTTPKSFNTPMGICRTVLNDLKDTDDFFIVEMGAKRSGDIEFLTKMIGVDFGIITPIGNCHLETFGSLQKIEDTKFELCKNSTGTVIFNGKSGATRRLYKKYTNKKYLVCEKNSFAFATNIKSGANGSFFTLTIDGRSILCQTKLLGKTNVDNIVVACAAAYLLGESLFSIQNAIKKLEQVPHRLELISGFVNVIDDSYNSNIEGAKEALKVLKTFKGQKVVVSPGIVELGKEQENTNEIFGRCVAKVADIFLIMNATNKEALFNGAIGAGLKRNQIYFAKNRQEQQALLKKILNRGDCVLFENDFPDNIK